MRVPSLDIFSHCGAAAAASEADELEHLWALRDAFAAALHTRGPKAQPVIAKLRKATEGLLKVRRRWPCRFTYERAFNNSARPCIRGDSVLSGRRLVSVHVAACTLSDCSSWSSAVKDGMGTHGIAFGKERARNAQCWAQSAAGRDVDSDAVTDTCV